MNDIEKYGSIKVTADENNRPHLFVTDFKITSCESSHHGILEILKWLRGGIDAEIAIIEKHIQKHYNEKPSLLDRIKMAVVRGLK